MSEIDRRFDAAWRAASREEPPSTLDDSIRAAARRAVGAGPGGERSTSWWHAKTHWVPIAAAAVVAVIAVGLVQLTPPEQVHPAFIDERSAPAPATEPNALKPEASQTPISGEGVQRSAAPEVDQLAKTRSVETPRTQVAQVPQAPQSAGRAAPEKKPAAAPSSNVMSKPARDLLTAPPSVAAAPPATQAPAVGGTAATSEPFPARAPTTYAQVPPPSRTAAAPMARPPALAAAEPSGAAPSPPSPSPLASAAVSESVPQTAGTLGVRARTKMQPGVAGIAADRRRVIESGQPLPPDEWIQLIRKLRVEGKTEEAAKQLAAFRAAYKERANDLLPRDLREIKP